MALHFDCRHRYEGGFVLDVKFAAGEGVTAICGPSGSGKTTVLMLVAGLLRPRRGRIVLGEQVLVDTGRDVWTPPHRRQVGVVFQDSLLFPHRNVRANLNYGLKRRPGPRFPLERVVEVLELDGLLDRYPTTLSGGQARRVAIGRALLRGPKLLMLDEPWTGLDEPLRRRASEFLQRCIAEWRIPTLLVSHDHAYVAQLADRIINIQAGILSSPGHDGNQEGEEHA